MFYSGVFYITYTWPPADSSGIPDTKQTGGLFYMSMSTITGHTGLTALLGSPVAHSISPLMHNEAFRLLGLDYVYLCFDVNEETLPAAQPPCSRTSAGRKIPDFRKDCR